MTLKMYDPSIDELRDVTQADIDRFQKSQRSLGLHRQILKKIVASKPVSEDGSFDEHFRLLQKMLDCE